MTTIRKDIMTPQAEKNTPHECSQALDEMAVFMRRFILAEKGVGCNVTI